MKLIFLISLLLVNIKNEKWYGEITGYDINNKNKYAGTSGIKITHFYLCGSREYYIHRLGDPWNIWSNAFVGCEPAGNGVPIDGICIKDAKYRVRLTDGKWMDEISRCNICENTGETFAGKIGVAISSIAIEAGNDVYSVATSINSDDTPNNEKSVIKIVKSLFGVDISFTSEQEILTFDAGKHFVSVKLTKSASVSKEGDITFNMENGEIKGFKWTKQFKGKEFELSMKDMANFTPFQFKNKLSVAFKSGMSNGKVSITYDPIGDVIIIEALTTISEKRVKVKIAGGFKIFIFSKGDENKVKFMEKFIKFPAIYRSRELRKVRAQILSPSYEGLLQMFNNVFTKKNMKIGGIAVGVLIACVIFQQWPELVLLVGAEVAPQIIKYIKNYA